MPTPCPYSVQIINSNEYIGDSLEKINSNFTALASATCHLEQHIQKVNVRTFFYYGPSSTYTPINSPNPQPTSGMDDGSSTRPSNTVIETFVNSTNRLNLLSISRKNDQVYIVYQKTGWAASTTNYTRSGTGSIPYTETKKIPITRTIGIADSLGTYTVVTGYSTKYVTKYANYSWSTTVADNNISYSPNFVVYRLTHDGTTYKVDMVRFVRAQTVNTINWNNPKSWITY